MRMKFLRKTGLYGKIMLLAAAMLMALAVQPIFASDSDFTTKKFDVDIKVKENHMIYVKERITVDFNQSAHHGITRFIPYVPKMYTVEDIESNTEIDDIATDSKEDRYGNPYKIKSVRLGSEDKLLSGINTFEVRYVIKAYKDDDEKFDFFSQNIFPTAWVTDVESSKITVAMPKKVDWGKAEFYSGSFGSTKKMGKVFTKKIDEADNKVVITGKNIPARYGATMRVKLPEGYWVNPADRSQNRLLLYILLGAVPLILAVLWFFTGRDPKLVKTVEFYPPDAMTPAEVGYIIDGSADGKDISTMIFYFASKGYLKIREDENESISLIKMREIPEEEKEFAKTIFNGIFIEGDVAGIEALPETFGEDIVTAQEQLRDYVEYSKGESSGVFTLKSQISRYVALALTAVCGALSVYLIHMEATGQVNLIYTALELLLQLLGIKTLVTAFDYADSEERSKTVLRYVLGFVLLASGAVIPGIMGYTMLKSLVILPAAVISSGISSFFTVIMRARTCESAKIQGRIMGFKTFIKNAEYNRLKLLSEENPEYFFNIIPYAHVMGMASVWAKKFDNLNIPQPSWYEGGSYDMITPIWYYSMIGRFDSSIQEQYANAISGSDSDIGGFGGGDFGGGGFSGGGFGGGGGGAW
ncbi:MAG: DUF2207 domain-containing protein [Hornefia sp.]|nr:DUF2207 domain-containing protein [Hornefia sp.]